MVIKIYPTKPEYKKLKNHKKQWLLVNKALNPTKPFDEKKQPFSDFAKVVNLRNDALHYVVKYKTPIGDLTPLYHSYCYENAKLSVNVVDSMIEHLSETQRSPYQHG
jgi:hypothetical protein